MCRKLQKCASKQDKICWGTEELEELRHFYDDNEAVASWKYFEEITIKSHLKWIQD